jgi:hypothetical protein
MLSITFRTFDVPLIEFVPDLFVTGVNAFIPTPILFQLPTIKPYISFSLLALIFVGHT